MAYQPPISFTPINLNSNNKPKNFDEDLLGLGYSFSSQPQNIMNQKKNDTFANKKKGTVNKTSLFDPDDILSTFGNNSSGSGSRRQTDIEIEEENELNIKESTSLLSAPSNDIKPIVPKTTINMNAYPNQQMSALQAKQAMQEKMRKANSSISSERPKNLFQRFIFDPYKYQVYFDTTTDEIQNRLIDALWPFIPANQHHLIENDAEQIREFQKKPSQTQELYGPIWVMMTLIIELCILGHLQVVLSASSAQYQSKYLTTEEILAKQANYSLSKVFKTTFLVLFLFFVNPFVSYLIFKNRGAIEVTYSNLFQIYSYSFAIFIPLAFLTCIFYSLNRLRIFLLLVSGAISLYYLYKETKEYLTKYILDEQTWKYFVGYIVGSTCFFMLLFRYYFLQA